MPHFQLPHFPLPHFRLSIFACFLAASLLPCFDSYGFAQSNLPTEGTTNDSSRLNLADTVMERQQESQQRKLDQDELVRRQRKQNERISFKFVRRHHPELEPFLKELKRKFPPHFHRATAEIAKQANRLNELEKRNSNNYEFAISIWKVESRIKLAATRNAINPSDELVDQIADLVEEQFELQANRLQQERDRLTKRLERVDEQLTQYRETKSTVIEERTQQIQKRAANRLKASRRQMNKNKDDKE